MPIHDYKVVKVEEMPAAVNQAVVILNKALLAPIEPAGGELNFGFRRSQGELHCKVASAKLMLRLAWGKPNIVLLQEPCLVGSKLSGVRTLDIKLIVPEAHGKIRTCLPTRKHLSIFLLHNFSNK